VRTPPFHARLTARLLNWWWVWTIDTNGAVRLRRVHGLPGGPYTVTAICPHTVARLYAGGMLSGVPYMARWQHAYGAPWLSDGMTPPSPPRKVRASINEEL
jgi:hypothetical protein